MANVMMAVCPSAESSKRLAAVVGESTITGDPQT
jgi:hypothetical protein